MPSASPKRLLKTVCVRNMPYAEEAFGTLGDVAALEGRGIGPDDVRDADLLATRSTSPITRDLLEGSRVQFYGTATIGTDHIDIPYLETAGIPWTAAPGCNANSVSEYVTAALLHLAGRHGFTLAGKTLGVVGVGNVGRRVVAKARALGMRVLANDPPRQRAPADTDARHFVDLEALLAESDVVSFHVPLNREGPDCTIGLADAERLAQLKPGAILINAARGPVVEGDALIDALNNDTVRHAVLDTWEGEPDFRPDLMARVDLGTPHIAGHSYEGKVNGTVMVYRAACAHLGVAPDWSPELPEPPVPRIELDAAGVPAEEILRRLVLRVYPISDDDARLRSVAELPEPERREAFDRQRKQYPMRREFPSSSVVLHDADPALRQQVAELGFALTAEDAMTLPPAATPLTSC